MKNLSFKPSVDFSVGVELEFQLIHPTSYNLIAKSKDLMRSVQASPHAHLIKPEATQSIFEINSSTHQSVTEVLKEIKEITAFMISEGEKLNFHISGGGTHPFQRWVSRKIFPLQRYRALYKRYKAVAKRSSTYGLHTHIGCSSPEHALYLTHILSRYVPQLIAISASSPFSEGIDTSYHSMRTMIFNSYPLCGTIPYVTDWKRFSAYFNKMKKLEIINSMKDFYWDIRPKPEFGSVEVRVCDMPLTLAKVGMIAAYIQSLAYYILHHKPYPVSQEIYTLYNYNKFQSARYGLEGVFIDPYSHKKIQIYEDILQTLETIQSIGDSFDNTQPLSELTKVVTDKQNDAVMLREIFNETGSLKEVVKKQCALLSDYTKRFTNTFS